jgi:hypothetical protein
MTVGNGGPGDGRVAELTLASVWLGASGLPMGDKLLLWPPDVFAMTDVLLQRADAFRFVLSPPRGAVWPPERMVGWADLVAAAARQWSQQVENRDGSLPELVADEWNVLRGASAMPFEQLVNGAAWRVCEALLTLHAIADESCAGLFVALDRSDGEGCVYRSRGRELLARSGSLSRIHPRLLRVLPKIRTPPTGRASFSRYACVQGPGFDTHWHKLPARHPGTDPQAEHAEMLLLPWPLRVRASDFRARPGSVQRLSKEPYGFFEFSPTERLDLDLVERVLIAALDEVDSIDIVVMPESALEEEEIAPLEALLDRHGVIYFQAGVRGRGANPGDMGSNWLHIGISPRLEKRGPLPDSSAEADWFHIRQDKHHRWSLDKPQIRQYNLGGALHPDIQWWEAMEVPPRSIQFVQVGEEVTIVSLVCEDLAQDDVAQIIRSVGPTIVVAVLLDGPQLPSRWGARYASVLADDPGSGVLTLTSFGMAQRARPPGHEPSRVIALWKDSASGSREISLDPGAHGVILTLCGERTTRRSADGRWPADTGTHYYAAAVNQVTAAPAGSQPGRPIVAASTSAALDVEDLTVLTGWAEGVAEALAYAPAGARAVLIGARTGAAWRAEFGVAEPSVQLNEAIDLLDRLLVDATARDAPPTFDAVLETARAERADEPALEKLVRRVLRSTLEQLRSRQAGPGNSHRP